MEEAGRVLVVAEAGHEPIVRALAGEGHTVEARAPAEVLGPVPDVVVAVRADAGAAVLAALERRHRLPAAPVIVLTGAVPPAERAGLLRAGAHTCLPDPVDPGELLAAVAAALAVQRSRTAPAQPEGLTDPLTGLGNRRLGERELELFVARSTRHGHGLSVVIACVDGAGAADAPLRDVGARLARTLRSGDVIVRWEAGEFLMMLPDTDTDGAQRAAERLHRAIADAPGAETVSVGWAVWHGEDAREFRLRADHALRRAREAGGDRVFPPSPAGA
jgi:diguanylate cyclase (GGDEF)-like protein